MLCETSKNYSSISSFSSPAFIKFLDSHVIVVTKYFANITSLVPRLLPMQKNGEEPGYEAKHAVATVQPISVL